MQGIDTVQQVAEEASAWFETATRDDSEESRYTRMKDGAPEWVTDLVRDAHGDFLPDDWRYTCIRAAVDHMASGNELDSGSFADGYVDVYTGARLAWLSSNLRRPGYVDDAAAELGAPEPFDIVEAIGLGQYVEASEVFGLVVESLEARAEELEA